MANTNCEACNDLRELDPNLIVNGFGDDECTSLKNDTGLVASSGNDDCTDLNNLNDCFIGNMATEVEAYDVCDWKTFMKRFIPNVWTVISAIICAICGIWENIHSIWERIEEIIAHLNVVSYIAILKLYRTTTTTNASTTKTQVLPFNASSFSGNLSGVLSVTSDSSGITINNTTSVPLLIETIFNCSIRTQQRLASCYLVVTRDGMSVGQTPFITPTTYDQQVSAEPFILAAGSSTTMRYYFGVGDANDKEWFEDLFYDSDGRDARMCLEATDASNPENQGSYFIVRATSIVEQLS